jgi:2-polyprenyl-3-methyl-5-hydroxy-6-metoxy-1,4-benzoquinol methylase
MSSLLVLLFGWRVTLHFGDALVWDRWRWLRRHLRMTRNGERLLDVGCGSGAFTIGIAKLGYKSLGLSWDARNQAVAETRARMARAKTASFQICDVRQLDKREDLKGQFDVVVCTENIEHIIDDFRLMRAMAGCLKPGGRLLLTTPQLRRIPQSCMDYGPFPDVEDGGHARRGYNRAMLEELCEHAGMRIEEIGYVSGPISQLHAWLLWQIGRLHPLIGWLFTLPLRPCPPLLDPLLTRVTNHPPFCIALEAYKPRLPAQSRASAALRQDVA